MKVDQKDQLLPVSLLSTHESDKVGLTVLDPAPPADPPPPPIMVTFWTSVLSGLAPEPLDDCPNIFTPPPPEPPLGPLENPIPAPAPPPEPSTTVPPPPFPAYPAAPPPAPYCVLAPPTPPPCPVYPPPTPDADPPLPFTVFASIK